MTKFNKIQSKIDDVSKLQFYPLPTKPVTVARAQRWAAETILESVEAAGIKLTASQAKRLAKLTVTSK